MLSKLYFLGAVATFIKLMYFDNPTHTRWNWMILVPINVVRSLVWPSYWLIVRPVSRLVFDFEKTRLAERDSLARRRQVATDRKPEASRSDPVRWC